VAEEKALRFAYTARNSKGEIVGGAITAEDKTAAARRLQYLNLAPMSIKLTGKNSVRGAGGKMQIGPPKRVKPKDLAILGNQFATMLDAGLPLVRSIASVADQTVHPELKRVLPIVQKVVEEGLPLSQAMARYPQLFPNLMIGMINAGEESGQLGPAMKQVARNYEKEAKLRAKVISALFYPGVVLGITGIMLIGMLIFVVPKFTVIFTSLGGELPLPTKILVTLSHSMVFSLPIIIATVFVLLSLWRKFKNDRRLRSVIDPLKLKILILGKFFQKIALARFSRTFSTLLQSGVPMLQTIEIVASTAGSTVISDALMEVKNAVHSGKGIAPTLAKYPVFPPLVITMVAAGEETGNIPEMLNKIAEFYEEEVSAASDALTSILEPVLIVFLAVIVGGMVIALYLPIFKVFDLIQ
jgi:type IV pilus assembly protein PilC